MRRRASTRSAPHALGAFCVGAVSSLAAAAILKGHPPGGAQRWTRSNHAGCPVTLLEGPAYAVGVVAGALCGGAGVPAAVAGLGAGALGAIDDLVGDGSSKGLRGHLAAVRRGELTTGAVKIVGLGVTGLATAWVADRSRERTGTQAAGPLATLVGGAVVAGSANMVNLLDLRPGRALKVVLLLAVPFATGGCGSHLSTATAAATVGAAMVALPDDLAGRTMLGDTGANSAGALIGTALVARTDLRGRLLALAALTVLTLASEKVSFTKVIESTPGLRHLDALGRSPQPFTTAVHHSRPPRPSPR
jgi:UDP-N-acetylmuramyl pentapeptide phosphotransferase/UDP-N-acetylglucosamine-1-phosphate transferase